MRILHVTECYASGVARAIETIAALAPAHEHHLLHAGDETPEASGFTNCTPLPQGFAQRVRTVRHHARDIGADVIHAHSSWAGVYARVAPQAAPVIYEPHALKFTDPSASAPHRAFYRVAERILGMRTDTFVVLSPQEDRLARVLAPNARRVMLPNAPQEGLSAPSVARGRTVVMSGRIAPQKDPSWFAEVSDHIRRADPSVKFRWIGDGEDALLRSVLERADVSISGWVGREALAAELAAAGVYLHSASYEGFPISVLDAAQCEVPIIARDIDAFAGTPLRRATTTEDAAAMVLDVLNDHVRRDEVVQDGHRLLSSMNPEAQRAALDKLYV